ncbi:unnamed protein product, partial [Prorocentrum cordatum]
EPLDGRIGVAIQGGRRTVSSLKHERAFSLGWRVGDVILEVNGEPVPDNEAVRAAVRRALDAHAAEGKPLRFKVRRPVRKQEAPTKPGMLRMTVGDGGGIAVPMVELFRTMLSDFHVVLVLDGKIKLPNNNLSARAIKLLDDRGAVYTGLDASDERYNPGLRAAVEELTGEFALPQLFVAGRYVGNAYKMEELDEQGELVRGG